MKFRPCIDLHNGLVKQIIGSTLKDNEIKQNFISTQPATYYATMFKNSNLYGGHIMMLGPGNESQVIKALEVFPKGLQVGGGINDENADYYISKGASHIIVTSFVFNNGEIDLNNLKKLRKVVEKDNIVLDLSSRKKETDYYIMTDKWSKFTNCKIDKDCLLFLSEYCDEFLVHAVDVEGKMSGVEVDLIKMLGEFSPITTTYAGGIKSYNDISLVEKHGNSKINFTVGSALDIYGGNLSYNEISTKYN